MKNSSSNMEEIIRASPFIVQLFRRLSVTHAAALSLPLWAATVTTGPDVRYILTDRGTGADPAGCKDEAEDDQRALSWHPAVTIIAALNRF